MDCLSNSTLSIVNTLSFISYRISVPVYFLIGAITRSVCVIAFYKQYKKEKEKAYAYQIMNSFSELLEVITFALSMTTKNYLAGGAVAEWSVQWYRKTYGLMWFAAHVASPLSNSFVTSSLLLSLSMASDRVLALWKPFTHKLLNHDSYQCLAFVLSVILGFATSAFDAFRYDLAWEIDHYKIIPNQEFVASEKAKYFAWIRVILRIIAVCALIVSNCAMIFLYRLHAQKVAQQTDNDQRAAKRKRMEKTLFLLTLFQSIFTATDITMINVYHVSVYTTTTFINCAGRVFAPISDFVIQIAGVFEFLAFGLISLQFRKMILDVLFCKKEVQSH